MSIIRAVIVIGQLGKIWAISSRNKKVFQSLSSIAYFYLMESTYGNSYNQFSSLNNIEFERKSESTKLIYKPVKFDKKPW